MTYTAGVILVCGAMAVLVGVLHQVWSYTRGRSLLTRRQFTLRVVNGCLLLLTVVLTFVLVVRPFQDPRLALLGLTALCILPCIVIMLALKDLHELRRVRHARQAEIYQNLAKLQQDLREKDSGKG